ncbi:cytochrome P450 [Coprinopsis marcescibilis]|uniref:Cytochrome P450 n=1 Tax=Coprinopsis marcescibilis TaxID=230819 RepID=A0A5C3KYF9_COPMA|nr:cytochrome P450 [Coprinopsis marcescibilis]
MLVAGDIATLAFPAVLALACLGWATSGYFRRRLPLPPGPKGYPLVGNLFDIPPDFAWEKFNSWCKYYNSDILHLRAAGTTMIVLNSFEAAIDLFEKRSSIYSGRPKMTMVREMMGWEFSLAFKDYGAIWRKHRKPTQQALHPNASKDYLPHINKSTRTALARFLDHPAEMLGNLRLMSAETITSSTYGIKVMQENDIYVKAFKEGVEPVIQIFHDPTQFLVEIIPVLKHIPEWFPGAGFKRRTREWKEKTLDMIELPFGAAKTAISNGTILPSFVSHFLERSEELNEVFEEDVVKECAGALYAAGSDTTVSTIFTCMLCLVKNPEITKRAQRELDSVIVSGCLPDFSDEDRLPYVTAIVNEAIRWQPVTPQGVPHTLSTDDEYEGFLIPAGSVVIPNIWAMCHDENMYPDSFKFNPDRFLKDGNLDLETQRDPSLMCFGFGRRICPGRHFAYASIWLAIASIIYIFDLEKAKDENGNEIDPPGDYDPGLAIMAKPFKYQLRPRSKDKEDLVRGTQ